MSRPRVSRMLIALAASALIGAGAVQAQTTWYVDDDAPNDPGPGDPLVSDPLEDGSAEHPFDAIQEAIDAASDGDTVLVADGTYTGEGNSAICFGGRLITVRSESGPQACVIDAEDEGPGFVLWDGETRDAVIDGFTITHACRAVRLFPGNPTISNCVITENTNWTAAVDCGGTSSPLIVNSVISNNVGGMRGGGIFCGWRATPTIMNCTITENTAENGGGIYCYSTPDMEPLSNPLIINCTISSNVADPHYGGGIYAQHCNPTVIDCLITDNRALSGGGINCEEPGQPLIVGCTIAGNSAVGGAGGGIEVYEHSSAAIVQCTITGNTTTYMGGGIRCSHCPHDEDYGVPEIVDCLISGNDAGEDGGGISLNYSGPRITNCTIAKNTASGFGGGVSGFYSDSTIGNCVAWDNTPDSLSVWPESPVMFSDIEGGWPGNGNIDADPLFVDPDGPDDDPNTWEDNDYRLSAGSPCIDAADNTAVPLDTLDLDGDGDTDERIPFDLDGNPRFVQDPFTEDTGVPDPPLYRHVVDMGAYEYQFCFGDLDDDDDVDIADLAQLLGSYGETAGMTYYDGDLDADGDVDLADLAELLGAYGTTCN